MASPSVAQAILPRVVAAMGARADLSVDDIRECIAVVDTVLAGMTGGVVRPGVAVLPGGLEVHVGPWTPPERTDGAAIDPVARIAALLCRPDPPRDTSGATHRPWGIPPWTPPDADVQPPEL